MIFRDITQYEKRDKTEREPNGRRKRSVVKEFMVYLAQQEGSARIKVGRTQNASRRIQQYEQSSGVPVRYVAQLVVRSLEDSIRLESHVLAVFKERYDVFKKEWFLLDTPTVVDALFEAIVGSPVEIIDHRGLASSRDYQKDFIRSESGLLWHTSRLGMKSRAIRV